MLLFYLATETKLNQSVFQRHLLEQKIVIGGEIALYDELTAFENLMFWGSLYRVPHKQLSNRANELLNLFALSDRKNDKLKNYSGGMKRRINIASA